MALMTERPVGVGTAAAPAGANPERPDPEWVNGRCPLCGEETVSNCYYVGGKGYLLFVECWSSLGDPATRTCDYRRVL